MRTSPVTAKRLQRGAASGPGKRQADDDTAEFVAFLTRFWCGWIGRVGFAALAVCVVALVVLLLPVTTWQPGNANAVRLRYV